MTLLQELRAKIDCIDHSVNGSDHGKIFHAFTIEVDAGYTDDIKSAKSLVRNFVKKLIY